jgi:short-chain 2-methylacyl-CoA dehydrogenase
MTITTATTDLGFTEEQLELRAMVRDFADTVVAPASYEHDRAHTFPYEIVAQMGEMGLFGLPIPEEYGGQGGTHVELCIALEQLGRVDQSVAITLEAGVGLGMMPILHAGTEEQKQEWLPLLATGEALAGFGLTEPEAGSDAGATRTTAVLEDGEWVINGAKQFITNSGTDITKLVTITAVTGRNESGKPELSAILLPSGTPGFEVGQAYDKVGWNASDTHPLSFQDARVPEANLLGERGRGYANFLRVLDEGRVAIAALATGVAQGCLEQAVDYAKSRTVFGQPIGSNQHIAFLLARMHARAHTARLATYDAAHRLVAGMPFKTEASIAKMISSEAAMDNARDATQIFGGYGFMNEYPVARHYRDSKILEIGEGTTEVQLTLIARELGF